MNLLEKYVRLIIEQEFKTKLGQAIDINVIEDEEGNENRGWIVHRFNAYINGHPAGYLKVSYIPHERFKEYYNHFADYASRIEGKGYVDTFDKKGFKDLSLIDQIKTLARIDRSWPSYDSRHDLNSMSNEELLNAKNELTNIIKNDYPEVIKLYKQFANYHVDKPLVDYINVEPNFRRQRIAAALYEYAAKWLAKRGMKLYASGIQTEAAQAAWKWLKQNKGANIGTEKTKVYNRVVTRTYLSYL